MHLSSIDASLSYEASGPAHFCFNLETAHTAGQRVIAEELLVSPNMELRRFCDTVTGNRFLRFDAPAGPVRIQYRAQVERKPAARPRRLAESPITEVPDEVLPYLMPTRYCQSDLMSRAAQQLFGKVAPGLGRVQAISDWVNGNILYEPGSTNSTSTAKDVFVQRAGVCRDFAHLGLTFCRALNIPARLVVGYVWFDEPPQDFHAVFEAWIGGRWVLFDPTRMAPLENLVRVGTGRDAKDVAFCTIFGPVRMREKNLLVREYEAASAEPLGAVAAPESMAEGLVPASSAPVRRIALAA